MTKLTHHLNTIGHSLRRDSDELATAGDRYSLIARRERALETDSLTFGYAARVGR
jgi:hypothetical protein